MIKFQIKNFKCFGEEGAEIPNFKDINVIIGKNNTGKSSIIDVVRFLTTRNQDFLTQKRDGKSPSLIFDYAIRSELIQKSFPSNVSGGRLGSINHQKYGLGFVGETISFSIDEKKRNYLKVSGRDFIPDEANRYFENYISLIQTIFDKKQFIHLTAERDIQPEISDESSNVRPNGIGATNLIQQIINKSDLDSRLIEVKLLEELNKITNPDINFTRILVQLNDDNRWEIYFENPIDGRIPLSKMGSGIKTILLVLILLIIKPRIENKNASNYIFALEELENNLHPSQQRRLYYYLYNFSKDNNCKFFLTTHSNIVIDLYNKLEHTQILHVVRKGDKTEIKTISQHSELNNILDDLDIKASDILQSNSIIWVEGPSDRTYINKWISLIEPDLVEGYHYSIMFYGGRLLSNLTLDYENLNTELIPLLKLNRNCFVVMDRDGKTINTKLNDTKNRIANEIGENNIWITKGREIENYISINTIKNWLENIYQIETNIQQNENSKFETNFEENSKTAKIKYNLNKNKFALELVEFITEEDVLTLDLKQNIEQLIRRIKQWNNQ